MDIESRKEEGIRLFQNKKFKEAILVFQECLDQYNAENNHLAAAEMRNNLSVAYLKTRQNNLAYQVVADTDQVFAAAGDQRKQAVALSNTATALESLNRFKEALEKYTQALAILSEINDTEYRTDILRRVSELQLRTGQTLQAVASMESALDQDKSVGKKTLRKILTGIKKRLLGF